jgi:hypothetical protein
MWVHERSAQRATPPPIADPGFGALLRSTNIPADSVSKGEEIVPWIQATPSKGSGTHRFAFLLCLQAHHIAPAPIAAWNERSMYHHSRTTTSHSLCPHGVWALLMQTLSVCITNAVVEFPTAAFLEHNELTPCGLSFFTTSWDASVSEFYNSAGIVEPVYANLIEGTRRVKKESRSIPVSRFRYATE